MSAHVGPGGRIVVAVARTALVLAALKVAGALAGGLVAGGRSAASPVPLWVDLVLLVAFGAVGAWLLGGGRQERVRDLGGALLLTAAAFSGRHLASLAAAVPAVAAPSVTVLRGLQVDALLPFFIWSFANRFPRAGRFGPAVRLGRAMKTAALAVGLLLLAADAVHRFGDGGWQLAARLSRAETGPYWASIAVLTLTALIFIVWRARRARAEERRRARLFVAALALGLGPLFLEVLLHSLVPAVARFMMRPAVFAVAGLLFYTLLLSIPFTTAYAVTVQRVFDVRLVIRQALRYGLARYTVIGLAALPILALAVVLYRQRMRPLGEALSGTGALVLMALAAAGIAAARGRRRLLESLDRRFFREQYDARQILGQLARTARGAATPQELALVVEREIDRALHLYSLAVLVRDDAGGRLVAAQGGVRALAVDSALARAASRAGETFAVDLLGGDPLIESLPEGERQWLADGGFELLAPVVDAAGALLALVALGEKRSELPFSGEDRALLADIAQAAALALEGKHLSWSGAGGESAWAGDEVSLAAAAECLACGRVAAGGESCQDCGGGLTPAALPDVLAGKFRVLHRLGAGGMGVVYLGQDLVLARQVAIKTLPRLSPERSLRMRREARAMAAVGHPNLVSIYGAETWCGTPLLVLEYLEGGTLEQRLTRGSVEPAAVIELGISLAGALAQIHAAGILHRDIKPSNIGFDGAGTPKLLDFGLARILAEEPPVAAAAEGPVLDGRASAEATMTLVAGGGSKRLVGTPLYLSPEAVAGREPRPDFDLWALAVVLAEAVCGRNPFVAPSVKQVLERIAAPAPPLRTLWAGCPEPLAELLDAALAASPRSRPASALELAERLTTARRELAMADAA